MKSRIHSRTVVALMLVCIIPPLHAQIVNDGETKTLSNVTNSFTGDVIVGTNGSFTLLVLADNALLTNSANSIISLNATARSNEVHLVSPTARWLMNGMLRVGSNGPNSTLIVSNGAFVRSTFGQIGTRPASGSNLVLVTGSGSTWSNMGFANALSVGGSASGNQLIVSDGGQVLNVNGSTTIGNTGSNNLVRVTGSGSVWSNFGSLNIGLTGVTNGNNRLLVEDGGAVFTDSAIIGGQNGSSNNFAVVSGNGSLWRSRLLTVGNIEGRNRLVVSNGGTLLSESGILSSYFNLATVTGNGSVWSNDLDLAVGVGRTNNVMVVSNGGWVINNNAYIGGQFAAHIPASNNSVVVTGAGSTWSNRADLFVGFAARGNQLVVSNGATVVASNLFTGFHLESLSNRVTVDGGTLRVTNSAGTGVLDVRRGTSVLNAGLVEADFLAVTNTLIGTFEFNGGKLITRGAHIDQPDFGVRGSLTNPAIWDLRPGVNHYVRHTLAVGDSSHGNQMFITDGAVLTNVQGASIGLFFGLSNAVLVAGAGSKWMMPSLLLGYNGWLNRLIVSNGAVAQAVHTTIGYGTTGSNNLALVTGAGSLWTNLEYLWIGNNGSANQLVVSNGATVLAGLERVIGKNPGANANTALVTGAGSSWLGPDDLEVGMFGSSNRLIVSEGARVENGTALIGDDESSSNNLALVTGAGSLWTNREYMWIGYSGRGNQLVVSNGGTVFAEFTRFIGDNSGARANSVLVTGTGSSWLGPDDVEVGIFGDSNQLIVSEGARVENNNGYIGRTQSGSNNLALVTGAGSVWSNTGEFHVGHFSVGNQLVVSNGGFVSAESGEIGAELGSVNNQVLVMGAGSKWNNTNLLYVGNYGASNRLVVADGGAVRNADGYVGGNASASNNLALVTGAGSTWTNLGELHVGLSSRGNQLVVSNGGRVTSGPGTIGGLSGANSNRVEVTDAGSAWINQFDLTVGEAGEDNQLVVSNGALIVSSNGIIGFGAAGDDNVALVSGGGSVWSNQHTLTIGDSGSGNRLEVSQGARVESQFATLGRFASALNNQAVVTGPGSLWKIEQGIEIGLSGRGNRLVISDGGFVAAAGSGRALIIGDAPNSANNEVLITGNGSVYTNAVGIHIEVGNQGYANRLRIENGGLLAGNPIIGGAQTSTGNVLTVTGPGSRIFASRPDIELIVGDDGPGNFLVVSNGAAVFGNGAAIGYAAGSSNNLAVVTGAGSVWSNQNVLKVGDFGRNNRLLITDGGTVSSTNAVNVGFRTSSSNNLLHVANGTLSVTNLVGTGTFDIRRGTNRLDAGLIEADQLVLTNAQGVFEFNGGTLITRGAAISKQEFYIGGPGGIPATWDVRAGNHVVSGDVMVGELASSFNQLLVIKGALLTNSEGFIRSKSNSVVVAGPGSRWVLGSNLELNGSYNSLVISNGGSVADTDAVIGEGSDSSNNLALVTGTGSVWSNQVSMRIGFFGSNSRLVIADGGAVFASNAITVGFSSAASSNNLIQINAGTLRVQNLAGTGALDIRSGTNRLDAGLVDVDRLVITNGRGEFEFHGGMLRSAGTTIGHGRVFTVGNGADAATLELRGGTHIILGGLVVANHATLTGNGSIPGALTVQAGGTLAPGLSIGALTFNVSPALQGATIMEISKNGATPTNDQIQVASTLSYGGSLTVTNIGPDALIAGSRFPLFSASGFAGAFTNITLPPLASGLAWTNKLAVDGSFEVVSLAPLSPPTVTIQHSNNLLTVSWPSNAFRLETTFALAPPVLWQEITNGISYSGGLRTFTLTNDFTAPNQFFRLVFP